QVDLQPFALDDAAKVNVCRGADGSGRWIENLMLPAKRYRPAPCDLELSVRCFLLHLQKHHLHLSHRRPASSVGYAKMVVAGVLLAYGAIGRFYPDPRTLAVRAREIQRQLWPKHLRSESVAEQGN